MDTLLKTIGPYGKLITDFFMNQSQDNKQILAYKEPETAMIKFNSTFEDKQSGKTFTLWTPKEVNQLSCGNYGLYYNTVVNQLNNYTLPGDIRKLCEYSDIIVNKLTTAKTKKRKAEIAFCNIEKYCSSMVKIQKMVLEQHFIDTKDDGRALSSYITSMFAFFNKSEEQLKNTTDKHKQGKSITEQYVLPFSRITSDLINALYFFSDNHDMKLDCMNILNEVLANMTVLENATMKDLVNASVEDVKQHKSMGPNASSEFYYFDRAVLKSFRIIATAIEKSFVTFDTKILSYQKQYNNSNQFVSLYITNRFLTLISMLNTVGNFSIAFNLEFGYIIIPEPFLKHMKSLHVHYLLSFADLSVYLNGNNGVPKAQSSFGGYRQLHRAALKTMESIPLYIQDFAKGTSEILNDPYFEPSEPKYANFAFSVIKEKFYCIILPEMFKIFIKKNSKQNLFNEIFIFDNFKNFEAQSFHERIVNYYLNTILKGDQILNAGNPLEVFSSWLKQQSDELNKTVDTYKNRNLTIKSTAVKEAKKLNIGNEQQILITLKNSLELYLKNKSTAGIDLQIAKYSLLLTSIVTTGIAITFVIKKKGKK